MPIKKKVNTGAQNPAADPRTAAFSAHGPAPAYQPVPEPEAPISREGFLNATLDRELNYFFNVANGFVGPDRAAPTPTLVLNLFRSTDPTKKPVAERFFLGQAQGAPYYALYANPSIRCMDEFNTLQITRRDPMNGNHISAATAELQPKLDFMFEGTVTIARIEKSGGEKFTLVRTGNNPTDGESRFKDSIALWSDAHSPALIAQFVLSEGWRGLDDKSHRGIIHAKSATCCENLEPHSHSAANPLSPDLAFLDFAKPYPQFVSRNHRAHIVMDILIAGLFATMIYETRRANHVGFAPRVAPIAGSTYVPSAAPGLAPPQGSGNSGEFEELLTCSICMCVMHNPVSLDTHQTNLNDGCMHNFCGACIIQLLRTDDRCPECRGVIRGVNDNRNLSQIIERFLQQNPQHKHSAQELASMDSFYRPGQVVRI